ncbi:hypothetical protein I7I48_11524 [Histoplasma ohiense]|nr:hypothetical protein I7I48_11524 [Histoplasma ohiense (nom. inval.)]
MVWIRARLTMETLSASMSRPAQGGQAKFCKPTESHAPTWCNCRSAGLKSQKEQFLRWLVELNSWIYCGDSPGERSVL